LDVNNYIFIAPWSDGSLYLGTRKGGNLYQGGLGAYSADVMMTFVVIWTPTKVHFYKDGASVYTMTDPAGILTTAGKIDILTGAGGTMDVDYVDYITSDETDCFREDGSIVFDPPSDWKQDTVNSVPNKFWLRVRQPNWTTPPTVNQIQLNRVYNCLMSNVKFSDDVEAYNETPYGVDFEQQENP
jgi:hypothetical protein